MAWPRLLRPFFKKSQVFGYKFSNLPLHFKNFLLSFSICFPCFRLFQLPAYAAKYKCEEQNNEGGNDKPLAFSQLSNSHDQELFIFLIQYKPFTVRPDGKRLLRNLFWERVKTNVLTTVKFVKALSSHANRGMIFRRAAVFFPILLLIHTKAGKGWYEHFPGSPLVLIVPGLHFSSDYDFSVGCERRLAVSWLMKAILNSFNNILYSNKALLKVITLENAVQFIVDKVNSFRYFNYHWLLPLRAHF